MANDPQGAGKSAADGAPASAAGAQAGADEQPQAEAPRPLRLNRAGWRERARITFGVSPHALAGALYDIEEDAELSEQDVRARLDEFSARETV